MASGKGFTSRYSVYRLVRFKLFDTMHDAISREKQLKRWHRQWKINLIEKGKSSVGGFGAFVGVPLSRHLELGSIPETRPLFIMDGSETSSA